MFESYIDRRERIAKLTRRSALKVAGGALGLSLVVGSATGHKFTTDGPLGEQFDGNRPQSAENTTLVGYHSGGGIGSEAMSGSPDDPHWGAFTELRVHDDIAVQSVFSSRDDTPGRGMMILDIGDYSRATGQDDLDHAGLTVLSFYGNDNPAGACMDVKLSDDGQYAFISKQPVTALFDETELSFDLDDDADDGGGDGAALEVVDISDPGNPSLVTQTTLSVWALGPHNAWYHQIGGEEYVFTVHGEDGLTGGINVFRFDRDLGTLEHVNWWNFSAEMAEPETETDTTGGAYYAHDIVVQDDPRFGIPVAYLANWDAGTRLLDMSDPTDIEEIGLFEMERSHHTVPAPTLVNGKRVFIAGHETPASHENWVRNVGASGHYYLVDADPIDAALAGERDEPVYLGISSTMPNDGVEPGTREPSEMYTDATMTTELDHWILFEDIDQTFDETPGFEAEADDDDRTYEGFDDFNLSAHNIDIDSRGFISIGHYHAGTRFLEITDDYTVEPIGYSRIGIDVPEDSTLEALTTGTPFHWCAVMRNGVTFAGGINAGPQAIAHDDIIVGEDPPIDVSIEREADASLFTAGQTSQVKIHVDADEPVQVRDRLPASWIVEEEHGNVASVETIGDNFRQVVTLDEFIEEGTLRYYVTVPDDLLDTFTIGPVEYARPSVGSTYGGGVSTNNYLWRKVNAATVTKTVVGVSL